MNITHTQAGGAGQENPYLTGMRAKYRSINAEITAVQQKATTEGRDLTEDELTLIRSKAAEGEEVYDQITEMTEREERTRSVDEMAARVFAGSGHGGDSGPGDTLRPYSLIPTAAQLTQIRQARRENRDARVDLPRYTGEVLLRSTVELSDTGGPVAAGHGVMFEPRRLATTLGLIPQGSDSSGASGPRFGATSGQAPTAEGETKPEAADITKLDIVPQFLARWTDVSRHALLSQPGFLEQLTQWHAQFVAKDEDRLIITAAAAAAGAPISGGLDPAAAVRTAIAVVTDAVSAAADVVLVHPLDYADVTEFAPTSGSDVGSWAARIGPALVYPSSSVSQGVALVAALRAGGRLIQVTTPQVASLEDLKSNEITIRTEEMVGFGVRLAGSVVAVSLDGDDSPS